MIRRAHLFGVAAAAMLLTATISNAQVAWPCATATVINTTGCKVTLNLNTTPAGLIGPINLKANQTLVGVPTPVLSIDQVVTAAGTAIFIAPPPPPIPCACAPGEWSVSCVTLPPAGCCFDVCFDPTTCTITLRPAACPGPCTP